MISIRKSCYKPVLLDKGKYFKIQYETPNETFFFINGTGVRDAFIFKKNKKQLDISKYVQFNHALQIHQYIYLVLFDDIVI